MTRSSNKTFRKTNFLKVHNTPLSLEFKWNKDYDLEHSYRSNNYKSFIFCANDKFVSFQVFMQKEIWNNDYKKCFLNYETKWSVSNLKTQNIFKSF